MQLLIFLLIGALAGWLAGVIMQGRGFGVIGNIVIGIIGAFLGGWLLPTLGIHPGSDIGTFIAALVGALILLCIVGLIRRA